MRRRTQIRSLFDTTSVVAALIGALQPATAAQNTITQAIYAGGSSTTLVSQVFRQLFDCYMGQTVGGDNVVPPMGCQTWATVTTHQVEGLYADLGTIGNGFRGFISNNGDEWYSGNVAVGQNIPPPFPAASPPYIDSNNLNFGSYPYPHVDMALNDLPLADDANPPTATYSTIAFTFVPTINWQNAPLVQVTGARTVSYSTGSWGPAIQIPAFEIPLAIALNSAPPTTTGVMWQIQSTMGFAAGSAGSAIQLTEAQMCAIFSGLVTDWSDATTLIPVTTGAGALNADNFFYANTNNTTGVGAKPYITGGALPVIVVYRADQSITSFILISYLHNVCPLIDGNAHGYQQIFAPAAVDIAAGYKALPSMRFSDLLNNVEKYRALNGPNTIAGQNWVSATANGGVAVTISDGTGQPNNAGFIGYVSAEFSQPYAQRVTGIPANLAAPVTVDAPLSASLQNENLRVTAMVGVPGQKSGANFIAPTPAAVDSAWSDPDLLQNINAASTAADWNVYNSVFPATQLPQGGYAVAGRSVLPLTLHAGAYPLSGTTFLALYSCYDAAPRARNLVNFLKWLYGGTDAKVPPIIQSSGFHGLNIRLVAAIQAGYLSGTMPTAIADAPTNGIGGSSGGTTGRFGCTGIATTAGAN